MVVDDLNKAKKALTGAGLSFTESTLGQVELANKPGALAELAGRLAKKGINIDSAYATMPKGAAKAAVLFATSEAAKASETARQREYLALPIWASTSLLRKRSGKATREGLIQVELLNSRGERAVYWIPAAPEIRPGLMLRLRETGSEEWTVERTFIICPDVPSVPHRLGTPDPALSWSAL